MIVKGNTESEGTRGYQGGRKDEETLPILKFNESAQLKVNNFLYATECTQVFQLLFFNYF